MLLGIFRFISGLHSTIPARYAHFEILYNIYLNRSIRMIKRMTYIHIYKTNAIHQNGRKKMDSSCVHVNRVYPISLIGGRSFDRASKRIIREKCSDSETYTRNILARGSCSPNIMNISLGLDEFVAAAKRHTSLWGPFAYQCLIILYERMSVTRP